MATRSEGITAEMLVKIIKEEEKNVLAHLVIVKSNSSQPTMTRIARSNWSNAIHNMRSPKASGRILPLA